MAELTNIAESRIFRPCEPVCSDGITSCEDCQKKSSPSALLSVTSTQLLTALVLKSGEITFGARPDPKAHPPRGAPEPKSIHNQTGLPGFVANHPALLP